MNIPRIIVPRKAAQANKEPRPQLVLIIYDTLEANIQRSKDMKVDELSLPGKYALTFGIGDDGLRFHAECVADQMAHDEAEWHRADWFNSWSELPEAIQRKRDRNRHIALPTQVDIVLDWPSQKT